MGDGLKPLIAVTTAEMRGPDGHKQTRHGEPPRKELALGLSYSKAVAAGGGVPLVVPPTNPEVVESLLAQVAGVLLTGGPDLDPSLYGADASPELGPVDPEVDRFEVELARQADSNGLPLLAICRGIQTLNVARGGTLIQHVAGHRQAEPGAQVTHSVAIEPGSDLAELVGDRQAQVNSFHHQAIDRLGRGLRPVAWSPDGLVEGIEDPDSDFLVGVQWHTETLTDRPEHIALFSGLADTARRRRDRERVRRAA